MPESPQRENADNMSKDKAKRKETEVAAEYDFSQGIRGKYAHRFTEGTNLVILDSDIAEVFPDSKSVNEALRSLVRIVQRRSKNSTQATK